MKELKEFPVRFPFVAQDTFNYLAGKYGGNSNLSCVMQLNGKVNEEILNQAVQLSLAEEPILGCRLIEDDNIPIWEQCKDLDALNMFCC